MPHAAAIRSSSIAPQRFSRQVVIERTPRHVTAFLSANQIMPGVACELFFLDAAPLAAQGRED